MNPTVSHPKLEREEEEELLVQFEQFERDLKVENILKDVKSELSFLKDDSVNKFAQQLQQRDQQRRWAQSEREERVRVCQSPGHYPQFTCNWLIEGLDFCCNHWRHDVKRSTTLPPRPRKWKKKN